MISLANTLGFKDINDSELADSIKVKNKATGALFKWCRATLKCFDIYKKVEPLK
jgi:hypothetical protein